MSRVRVSPTEWRLDGEAVTPACMTSRELALWTEANERITSIRNRNQSPCSDCPVAFARAMTSEGCCNGRPGTRSGRPRLADTPQRRQWREASKRFRLARAREGWDNGGVGISDASPDIMCDALLVADTSREGVPRLEVSAP